MEKPRISAIAAVGKNRELGKQNSLIWKFDADFVRLKKLINGHPLIMGRATYESIGMELPHSPCVVITRDTNYQSPYKNTKHTHIVHNLDEAIDKAVAIEHEHDHEEKEVFIFGGSQVYSAALAQTDRLYLTEIDATDPEADVFFPHYDEFKKHVEDVVEHEEGGIKFNLLTLERH